MAFLKVKTMKNTALSLCLLLGSTLAFAAGEEKSDTEVKEEMSRFSDENAKMREGHIGKMREVHVKHVNDIYDRKLQHHKDIDELRKQMKVGDKEGNKALKKQIHDKRDAFEEAEKKLHKDFKENVLKDQNKAFRGSMKERYKSMKGKHKN
jgi:hypothetical protein